MRQIARSDAVIAVDEEDRRARAERLQDAAVEARNLQEFMDQQSEGGLDLGGLGGAPTDETASVEEVARNESFAAAAANAAAAQEAAAAGTDAGIDITAEPEPPAPIGASGPQTAVATLGIDARLVNRNARSLKRLNYALQIFESTVLRDEILYGATPEGRGTKRAMRGDVKIYKAVYRNDQNRADGSAYISNDAYNSMEAAEGNIIVSYRPNFVQELNHGVLRGYERVGAGPRPRMNGADGISRDAGEMDEMPDFESVSSRTSIGESVRSNLRAPSLMSISQGALSSQASSYAPSSSAAMSEDSYAPSGGSAGSSRTATAIAQTVAASAGVRNMLRDQAPVLGPNATNWLAERGRDIGEVEDLQEFMGSTTNNLAAIFSNAYTATPLFTKPRKQGVEGEYKKSSGSVGPARWGSMFEPRVEQTTSAGGDVFATAEKESDPRYALLHGRKPSASTYQDPNLAYTTGTFRQLESQSRSNRYDGNVDGPAEQNSLAIQNPAHARNMAHRIAAEFAHAPPESRQTTGVLNRNQRVPVSTVTIANRGSLSGDPATTFRAGQPRRR
jgi:hypothetical protein